MPRHPEHAEAISAPTVWVALLSSLLLTAVLYSTTAATGLGFHDSAELALRGSQLGATHAPGAPLHTALVFGLSIAGIEPAAAAAGLSVASAALTAAVATWILLALGSGVSIAIAGALAYATTYIVWGNAVVAELYALSTLAVAVTIACALRWRRLGYRGFPVALTLAYGCALAAHFANIILLPAFAALLIAATGLRDLRWPTFFLLVGASIGAIALANVGLAARVPPFGPYVPDSLSGIFGYMSGAEHDPLRRAGFTDYVERSLEHFKILGWNYLGVGLLIALLGAVAWLRHQTRTGAFALLVAAAYLGYFTWFGSGDYFTMVAPAYLVISICFALGAQGFIRAVWPTAPDAADALLPAALVCVALATQWEVRRADARSEVPQSYVAEAFAALPVNSAVVARWNEFTALNYAQVVWGQRGDLDFVVPARTLRHYPHGNVNDYLQFVAAAICVRPVITNKLTAELEAQFDASPVPGTKQWLRLQPRPGFDCP